MAGWDDLAVDPGEIESGYIFDTALLNTYIKAVNERGFYCGFDGSINNDAAGPNGALPLEEIGDDECLFHIKTIDVGESTNGNPRPLDPLHDKASTLFYRVGQMIRKTWAHESSWDDPLSVTSVADDPAASWSLTEIEDLITTPYYDIFIDPYADGIKLSDFQSAGIYNAIYTLFEEVFLYIDINDMSRDLFVDNAGKNRGSRSTFSQPFGEIGGATLAELNTYTDVTYKNIYDNTPLISEQGFYDHRFLNWSQGIDVQVSYSPGPGTYTFRTKGIGSVPAGSGLIGGRTPGKVNLGYDIVLNSLNHEGDIIELERKEVVWVALNCIQDLQRIPPFPSYNLAFSQNRADYPQVNVTDPPVRVLAPSVESSFIDGDGWHSVTEFSAHTDFKLQYSNFVFPVLPGISELTYKSDYFALSHFAPNEVTTDTYYNLNVEGMIYNTLPPA